MISAAFLLWGQLWYLRVFEIYHLHQEGNIKEGDILEQVFINSLIN